MNEKQLAIKVGLFGVVALVVLAGILLVFSKGQSWFTAGYTLRLHADNVGGLKPRSTVLISGVPVGSVTGTELSPDGKGVTIFLHIQKRYAIHSDAQFNVEQIGLLGDQYVVITPAGNNGPLLQDGDAVECKAPFSVQALAASAVGFIQRVDEATKMLKETIARINNIFLTEQTLTNLSQTIGNLRSASLRAGTLVDNLDRVVSGSSPAFATTMTNLSRFSEDINRLSGELRQTLAENKPVLAGAMRNLEDTTRTASGLLKAADQGEGLAGALFKDSEIRSNLSATLINLTTLSSNIARFGILYKPKPPKPETDKRPRYPGYSPAP
ncbi:MAG: phospholipid/cholesterol/gamma-HCH transport system substrate-binding protein [Verrucomicrobiota bacterium]|jgi:phospholipid/cholesterol/gamma-HCH transport system substrate-binding protein